MDLLGIVFWVFVGWAVMRLLKYSSFLKEMEQHIREEADRRIRVVKLEAVPDHATILAYDAENHQFLGQAASEPELKECIMKRFPEKIFLLNGTPFSAIDLEAIHK